MDEHGDQKSVTRRTSVFREMGLVGTNATVTASSALLPNRQGHNVRFRTKESVINGSGNDGEREDHTNIGVTQDDIDSEHTTAPVEEPSLRRPRVTSIPPMNFLLILLAVAIPLATFTSLVGRSHLPPLAATGVPMSNNDKDNMNGRLNQRQNSPSDVCKRWSQQSALVNGTLYLYGGRAITSSDQTSDTWNNHFLSLDLTHTWQISSPSLTGLPQPSGPPPVANGYLWNSFDSLYLYGGEFSDKPVASPDAFSLWEYNIPSSSWSSYNNPATTTGKNSEPAGSAIQRAAEGAGFAMANLGKGWYFGGHEDFLTTQGWSNQIPRIYLSSFIEFTYPGYKSGDGQTAGSQGLWRNITKGGIQNTAGFTQRADGLLVYVPGFGAQGILLSLAGGTNETFTQMNEVNVYDIAASEWYNQATSGPTPNIRVNPCAVVVASPDGSSYNIYMFGGQNLIPYDNQTQYNDMWILSVPSFSWIQVNQDGQSVPYPRAGHTCNVWDGQMIVVGGYIGTDISCESPGIYIFNLTSLQWVNRFTALTGPQQSTGSFTSGTYNPFSQQINQRGPGENSGLQGSYGYEVPAAVQSVIGGNAAGAATITAPIQSATSGPLVSGKPQTYIITTTNAAGATITETGLITSTGTNNNNNSSTSPAARIGAIAAGVVAFVLLVIATYLGFCAYVYRKQVQLYKAHVAAIQRPAPVTPRAEKRPIFGGLFDSNTSSDRTRVLEGNQYDSFWSAYQLSEGHGHMAQDSMGGSSSGGPSGGPEDTRSDGATSTEDLLGGREPTFVGVMLHPRRSLRVINLD